MTSWNPRANELFLKALGLIGPEERQKYLNEACAGDAALRAEVQALLEADAGAGQFLESPLRSPVETVDIQTLSEGPGAQIGPYKLLEQIGEGGFGVVFMAEQTRPVRRKAALKILKPGMDTRQVVARFEAERQALALMDHPNIAQVFDGGETGSGRPYFVMELVKGIAITDFCDQNHLTLKARLELFITVCRAVQHAHHKGILHRDIKPSNVLVTLHDDTPVVKVIDFGIAKAMGQQLTEKTLFTNFAQMIGTPLYMSPEQASLSGLDADTRSDVYSLGVLLYELLTGTTPIDRTRLREAGYDEIRRIIREEEPPRPSMRMSTLGQASATVSERRRSDPKRLGRLFRGELDWIVMKALEKDRNRRYESANAFAADVEHYLNNEAVQACPPSYRYRLRKFARRNKGPVLAASLVLLVLVGGIIGTTLGMIQANHAREREAERAEGERLAGEREGRERIKAERARDRALLTLNATVSSVVGDSLTSQKLISHEQKQFLGEVLGYYQEFAGEKADDADSRGRTALAANWVGTIEFRLGRKTEAEVAFRQARDGFENLVAEFPLVPEHRLKLGISYQNLGVVLGDLGKRTEAEEQKRRALAVLEKLANDFPTALSYRRALVSSQVALGMMLVNLGQWQEAEELDRKAVASQEILAADSAAEFADRQELAHCYNNLGVLLTRLGKWTEAEQRFQQALALQEKLAAEFPTVPRCHQFLARYHNNMGHLLDSLGKWPEVEQHYRQALALLEKLADNFLGVPEYRQDLANAYLNLGNFLRSGGRRPLAAEHQYRQSLAIYLELTRQFPTAPHYRHELSSSHINLGLLLSALGKQPEAEQQLREAVAIEKQLTDEFPMPDYRLNLARGHNQLGAVMAAQKRGPLAEEQYRLALKILEKLSSEFAAVPEYQITLGGTYCNLGLLLRDGFQMMESFVCFEKAIRVLSAVYERDRRLLQARQFLRNSYWGRAVAYDFLRKYTAAVEDWDKVIELSAPEEQPGFRAERAIVRIHAGQMTEAAAEVAELTKMLNHPLKPNQPNTLQALMSIARAYQDAHKLDLALPLFEDILKRRAASLPGDHPDLLASTNTLALAYQASGKLKQAVPLFEEIVKKRKNLAADHPDRLDSMNYLALCYQDSGKLDLALPLYEELLKRYQAKLPPDHPNVLSSMNNLAWGYLGAGKLDLAIPLYEEALKRTKSKFGQDNQNAARIMSNLGNCYTRTGQSGKAVPLLRDCLAIREKNEPDGWRTFDTKSMLGAALVGEKKYAEAEPLLLDGYRGLKERESTMPVPFRIRLIEALERLVQLYEARENQEKANEWRNKLAEAKDRNKKN